MGSRKTRKTRLRGRMNENQRRLRAAGYLFEPSPAGKRFWRQPGTERLLPEAQRLEEACLVRVQVEGDTHWRRPGSGRLYPRGAAYDVAMRMEGEDEKGPPG
jgi:hypothetical protein